MSKPVFTLSAESRLLYQALAKAKPGETVTYDALRQEVSASSLDAIRGALATARRRALSDDNLVFVCIKGVGLKCANADDVLGQATQDTRKVSKAARRGVKKLLTVDVADLDRSKQMHHATRLTMLSAAAKVTSEKTAPKIVAAIGERKELPIAETMKLFA